MSSRKTPKHPLFGVVVWRDSRGGVGPWRGGLLLVRAESEAQAIIEASRMLIRTSVGVELGEVLEMRGHDEIADAASLVEASRVRPRTKRTPADNAIVDGTGDAA